MSAQLHVDEHSVRALTAVAHNFTVVPIIFRSVSQNLTSPRRSERLNCSLCRPRSRNPPPTRCLAEPVANAPTGAAAHRAGVVRGHSHRQPQQGTASGVCSSKHLRRDVLSSSRALNDSLSVTAFKAVSKHDAASLPESVRLRSTCRRSSEERPR